MKHLFRKFKQISVLILAIAFVGCEDDDVVLPEVVAGFTYTINADTGTVTFINTTENATSYSWDFDDESTSTLINPINVYPNGTYTVVLTALNVAGASDVFEDTITISIPEIATLPITFDGANTAYDPDVFGGTSFDVVDNPDESGTNPNATKVGEVTNIGEAFEGISFGLGADIDLTTGGSISMNFWADAPIDVLTKLEEGTGGDLEATASHGGTGWETIIFTFSSSDSYPRLTIFVDGPGETAGTFYMDDITQIETPPLPCVADTAQSFAASSFNISFETDPGTTETVGETDKLLLGDVGYEYLDNPDFDNAVNSSCKVAKIDKAGAAPYANVQIFTADKFNLTDNAGFKLKIFSPNVGTNVLFKLEDTSDGGINNQVSQLTTIANGWEELTFDFPESDTNKFDRIIIFFGFEQGDALTIHFDELKTYTRSGGGGGTGSGLATNGDFETGDTSGWTTFVDAAGASFMATDAEAACGNFSGNLVADFEAGNGGAVDAVVKQANIGIGVVTPNTQVTISFDLRGSASDGGVFFAEFFSELSAGGTSSAEILSGGPLALNDTWTHYSFTTTTGSDVSGGITLQMKSSCGPIANCLVDAYFDNVFVDLGTTGGEDCSGGSGSGGGGSGGGGSGGGGSGEGGLADNGDFETGTLDGWAVYENGGSITVDDTESSGGTYSAKMVADPSGQNPTLKQERKGAGTISVGDRVQVTFDYKGSTAGESNVYSFQSFVEAADGVNQVETFSVTPTDTWQTFTNTYTVSAGDISGGITTEFVAICGGVAGCVTTLNLDNVSIIINP